MEPLLGGSNFYNVESNSAVTEELDRLCRICASPNDYLIPIFEGEGLDHKLAMKIEKYLPVKIFESDTLPLNVCYQCASTLIAWHDLFENSIKADKKLRELEDRKVFVDKLSDVEIYDEPLSVGSDNETLDQASTSSAVENLSLDKRLKNLKRSSAKKANKVSAESELSQKSAENEGYDHSSHESVNGKHEERQKINSYHTVEGIGVMCNVEVLESSEVLDFSSVKQELVTCEEREMKTNNNKNTNSSVINVQKKFKEKNNKLSNETSKQTVKCVICDVCNKRLPNRKKLKSHLKVHDDNLVRVKRKDKYFCGICQKGFHFKSTLVRHREVHRLPKTVVPDEGTVFRCDTCGKGFSSRKRLSGHFITHKEKCTCYFCGKSISFTAFQYHLKHVHGSVKHLSCDLCDKKFVNKRNLVDHMRIHTGEKPFMCPTCGKFFRNDNALYLHKRTHTDVFPYPCSICNKGFRNRKALRMHNMTHSGVKPCPCDICGKTFRGMSEVRSHMVVHFDDRPFVCPECGKSFKLKKYLKLHSKMHQKLAS